MLPSSFQSVLFRVVVSALFFGAVAIAQDVQMVPDQTDRDSATQAQQDQDQDQTPAATFKVSTEVVQFFFNVKDKKGGLIPNLPKDNFELLEDGKPQTIKYFSPESNL